MAGAEIPDKLRHFLFERVDSVELIEVLLFLRSQNGRAQTAEQVRQELRSSLNSVATRLAVLEAMELIAKSDRAPDSFVYRPKSQDLGEIVDLLEREYKTRRHKVLEIVFSPLKRARHFAEAFVVAKNVAKKDGSDG